jgi:hypothetical protein
MKWQKKVSEIMKKKANKLVGHQKYYKNIITNYWTSWMPRQIFL